MALETGMKWGRLVVVNDGFEYRKVGAITEPYNWVVLRCVCGTEWKMDTDDVNKHLLKDCGKCPPNVGSKKVKQKSDRSPGRPMVNKSKSMGVMVSLPVHLVEEAKKKLEGASFSALLAGFLEEWLEEDKEEMEDLEMEDAANA